MRLHQQPTRSRWQFATKILFAFFLTTLISIVAFSPANTVWQAAAAGENWEITYHINRSQVPALYYNDLTLNIDIGSANSVTVQVDGLPAPATYNSTTGIVQLTTSGSNVYLQIDGAQEANMPPTISKAPLLHNKAWAWSHGFDDNVNIKPAIAAFDSHGWQASVFMITSDIDETRVEPWIVDKPDLLNYLANGWGVGSHGYASDCSDYNTSDQLTALDILTEIVDDSAVSDYRITSFAVPCFRSEYVPIIMGIIQSGDTDFQFYETGNNYLRLVDSAHIRPHGSNNLPTFTANNLTAYGLELNGPLGRDYRIENDADIDNVKAQFDWMAANAAPNRHFWYNTLAHGFHEDTVSEAINHVYNNYGPNGTNEAWVAPSDEIYSYILVRDNGSLTLTSIKKAGTPWATPVISPSPTNTLLPGQTPTVTPTPTNTPQPTQTHTPSPTQTSTQTPTATPTQVFTPIPSSTLTPTSSATATQANTPIPAHTSTPAVPTNDDGYKILLPIINLGVPAR